MWALEGLPSDGALPAAMVAADGGLRQRTTGNGLYHYCGRVYGAWDRLYCGQGASVRFLQNRHNLCQCGLDHVINRFNRDNLKERRKRGSSKAAAAHKRVMKAIANVKREGAARVMGMAVGRI